MTNSSIFEEDDQEPSIDNVAVKFTLPGGLARNLARYAQFTSKSKTEIVKEAIEQRLLSDPAWLAGLFFFEKNQEIDQSKYLEALQKAPKGTLLKVAGLNKDSPDSAQILICNFIRARGTQISFDIPTNFRPTLLSESRYIDLSSVKLISGQLVLPHEDQNVGPFGTTKRWVYTLDIKYIWDVDCEPPQFMF